MTEIKPSGTLINLALLPFALIGILMLGTCGLCTMVCATMQLAPEVSTQEASP